MKKTALLGMGIAILAATLAGTPTPVRAQTDTTATNAPFDTTAYRTWRDSAWKPILVQEGVRVTYIFYDQADNVNNGVVIRLDNTNAYPVRYRFTIIFRTPEKEAVRRASGRLEAGQTKTGENDGLFWIPFEDQSSIGEVGLRGFTIRRTR